MSNVSFDDFGFDQGTEIVTRSGIRKLQDISISEHIQVRGEDRAWHDAEVHPLGLCQAYNVKFGKHEFICSARQSWPIMNTKNTLRSVKSTLELSKGDRIRFTVDCVPEYKCDIEAYKCGLLYCDSKIAPDILNCSEAWLFNWLQALFSVKGTVDPNGYHALITSTDIKMLWLVRDVCAIVGINTSEIQNSARHLMYYRLTLNKSSLTTDFFTNSYHLNRWDAVRTRPNICQCVKSVKLLDHPYPIYAVVTHGCDMFTLGSGELVGSPSLLLGDRNGIERKNDRGKVI